MTTTNLAAKYTTWISADAPTACYFGKTGYAAARKDHAAALVQFTSPFPAGTTQNVVRAVLQLRTRAVAGPVTLTVAALTAPFTPSRATWGSVKQGSILPVTKTGSSPSNNTVWEFDVTAALQRVASGAPFYGFIITTSNPGNILIQGNMSAALNPHLVVDYTQAPLPPTGLAPAAGRRVGTDQPMLRFTNTDHGGNVRLQACQVQLSTASSFTSPSFDSGPVATTIPQVDLTNLAGAPKLAAGTAYWWRVRTQDGAGLWSSWSLPAAFTYTPKPVTALVNPDPVTAVVYDPTPPIDWTYSSPSGSPQSRYAVGLYRRAADGRLILLDRSGVMMGAATRWTPTKALPGSGHYTVALDVWDSYVDREATPDCATASGRRQEFQYVYTTSIAAPTLVGVTKPYSRHPRVEITFKRVDQPDSWRIYRDGKLLTTAYGSALLRSGGDTYRVADNFAPAGVHTWTIRPVVNGKEGAALDVTWTNRFTGLWLTRRDDTTAAVCIIEDTNAGLSLPEQSATVDILGAQVPVTITTAFLGYQGTVDGAITPLVGGLPPGNSVEEWRQRLLEFKGDIGQEFSLVGIGDLELAVLIHAVTTAPIPTTGPPIHTAAFDFVQCDDFPVTL